MKPEKIVEIIKNNQDRNRLDVIYPMQYKKIASEISQEQEKEIKEAVELLKKVKPIVPLWMDTYFNVCKFIQEHENK